MAGVRKAVLDDAPAMADVHVRAWHAAYRGIMPDAVLDAVDADRRRAMWEAWLSGPHDVLVVEDDGARVAGFAATGAAHAYGDVPDPGAHTGELWVINLAPEHWGRGLGRSLLAAATDQLRRQGYHEAVLWVVERNARARRFYEIAGWREDGPRKVDSDYQVPEVRYRRSL